MSFEGLDPEAVGAVAERLAAQAALLERIAGEVDGTVRSALDVWPGPDADDFNAWWSTNHRPNLLAAARATHGLTATLRMQIQQQLEASGMLPGATGPTTSDDFAGSGSVSTLGNTGSVKGLSYEDGVITLVDATGAAYVFLAAGAFQKGAGSYRINGDGSLTLFGTDGQASATIDKSGVHLDARGKLTRLEAKGHLHGQLGIVGADVDGRVFVGAEAQAGADIGATGVHAGAKAFAGARAEASGAVDIGGVGGKATVEGWAGVGVEAKADLGFEDGRFHLGGHAGAAVGVGGSVGFELEVDVHEAVETIEKIDHLFDDVRFPWS